jgi:hypothetical protein
MNREVLLWHRGGDEPLNRGIETACLELLLGGWETLCRHPRRRFLATALKDPHFDEVVNALTTDRSPMGM